MNKMGIKMIVCDLDGTLLDDDKNVSLFTQQTIKQFHDNGYLFTIASGRYKDLILMMLEKWGLKEITDYIAYGNGFGYYNLKTQEDKTFYRIDPSIVDKVTEEFKDYNVGLIYHRGNYVISNNNNPELIRLAERDNIGYVIKDNEYFKNLETSKYIIGGEISEIDKIEKIAKKYPNVKSFRGTPYQYEYVDIRDSKANSLIDLFDKINISKEEVIVFGDMINDVDMLELVPNSVAMINGDEFAKKAAHDITEFDNNNDGVAKYLLKKL